MSNGNCERCGGEGFMARYVHVQGGRCFKCGRAFGAALAPKTLDRGAVIVALKGLIDACASRAADERGEWLDAVSGEDACPSLPGLLSVAPEDVRTRARAALARLGVAV